MAGMRIASTDDAGWVVQTVTITHTGRRSRQPGHSEPIGDGPQLAVTRHGHPIAYVATPEQLPAFGIDMSRMTVVTRC